MSQKLAKVNDQFSRESLHVSYNNEELTKISDEHEVAIRNLERSMIKMQSELEQLKSGHTKNETETYKIQIDTKATEAQQALTQALAEVQEKDKEIEKLQAAVQKLEDELKKSKSIEIQKYKNFEKDNTIKAQALAEKDSKIVALKEELQVTVQKLEELKQSKSEHDIEIQKYKNLIDVEKDNTVKIQDTLAQALAEKEETLALKEKLQVAVQKLEDELKQSKSEHDTEIQKYKDLSDVEKDNTVKTHLHTQVHKNQAPEIISHEKDEDEQATDHETAALDDQKTKISAKQKKMKLQDLTLVKTPLKDPLIINGAKIQQTKTSNSVNQKATKNMVGKLFRINVKCVFINYTAKCKVRIKFIFSYVLISTISITNLVCSFLWYITSHE